MARRKIKGIRCSYCGKVRPLKLVESIKGMRIYFKVPHICSICKREIMSSLPSEYTGDLY